MKFRLSVERLDDRLTPSVSVISAPTPVDAASQLADPNFFNNIQSGITDPLTYLITTYDQWYTIRFSGTNPMMGAGVGGLLARYQQLVAEVGAYDEILVRDFNTYFEKHEACLDFVAANPFAPKPLALITQSNQAAYTVYSHNVERNRLASEAVSILTFLAGCSNEGLLTLQQSVAFAAAEASAPNQVNLQVDILDPVQNPDGTITAPGWPTQTGGPVL